MFLTNVLLTDSFIKGYQTALRPAQMHQTLHQTSSNSHV